METFHLLHLASVWRPRPSEGTADPSKAPVPPTTSPVMPAVSVAPTVQVSAPGSAETKPTVTAGHGSWRIRAASVQMIFANRVTQDFIDPQQVAELESWSGRAVLQTLVEVNIPSEVSEVCATLLAWLLTKLLRTYTMVTCAFGTRSRNKRRDRHPQAIECLVGQPFPTPEIDPSTPATFHMKVHL